MEKGDQIQTHPPQSLIKVITDHEGIREESENMGEQQRIQSVSISMPPSPAKEYHSQQTKRVLFHSQPIEKISTMHDAIAQGNSAQLPPRIPIRSHSLRDKTFDTFKTFSGGLERQLSNFRGIAQEPEPDSDPNHHHHHAERGNVPVDRFFDALEGPELDVLRPSEKIILPNDQQWPFLLRFPITSFGICVGVSSQAVMWKTLASTDSAKYLHISPRGNHISWFVSIALMIIVSTIYALKIVFYFEAVRREYHHPIRVNFFFAPWITLLFLGQGVPSSIAHTLHQSVWYILMAPILCLELKIYGQWMSGGQRRLSKVANPSNHLSILGNFVGALLGANMGLKEGPIFFFAIGVAHYIVLFVTLYQRLPTNETLPKELHPVFFLFVAAPSVASMAWDKIGGSFDVGSRIAYFIAMFLYFSLAIRVNFFRGFRFSLAWWAYTSPMTGAAIASVRYSSVVSNSFTKTFAGLLCIIATLTVAALVVTTMLHAFVFRNLFPNDIGIAISDRRPKGPKSARRWYNRRSGSSDTSIQHYLKFADAKEDIEASVAVTVTDPAASASASPSCK